MLTAVAARQEYAAISAEIDRRRYLHQPDSWVEERLGEKPWSKQKQIMKSVVEHRYTAVPSCFGSGKSWIAARMAAYWIDVHPPGEAFVVSTARSGAQVKAILWRELHRAHSAGKLPGRLNKTEWWLDKGNGNEEIVAFGRKPDDLDPTAFQGIHERYVLVIIDEAAGVSRQLFEAASSLIVNEDSRLLAIGNPEDVGSEFSDACKPGSGWNVIRITAWDTPNFSGELVDYNTSQKLISKVWVEEKRRKWGEGSPMWDAKVEAQFPQVQTNGLFPIRAIREAMDRKLRPGMPIELGVDVGGGGDKNTQALRRGPHVRIIHKDNNPNTMESCGNVIKALKDNNASVAKIDMIGIGRGMVERGQEQKHPFIGVNFAQKAKDPEAYVNVRAEAYWELRERALEGNLDIDPEDEDLAAQLVAIRYKRGSGGRIQIESKAEMSKRLGISSPDEMDGVVLAFCDPPVPEEAPTGAVW